MLEFIIYKIELQVIYYLKLTTYNFVLPLPLKSFTDEIRGWR